MLLSTLLIFPHHLKAETHSSKSSKWLSCNEFDPVKEKDFSLDCSQSRDKQFCIYKDVYCELKGETPRSIVQESAREVLLQAGSYEWTIGEAEEFYLAGFNYDFICKKKNGKCPGLLDCMDEELSKYLDATDDEPRQRLKINVKERGEVKSVR